MNVMKKRLYLFCGITYGAAWIAILIALLRGHRYGGEVFTTLGTVLMFLPAAAMLICRKVTDQEMEIEQVGISPHLRGNVLRYLFSYGFPTLLACLCGLLFFLSHPGSYDPLAKKLTELMVTDAVTEEMAVRGIYSQVLMGVFAGPLVNLLISFAEALGFLGYLLPLLRELLEGRKLPGLKASLLTGLLWGLWYAPLLACGDFYSTSYPGYPYVGILLGMAFYTLLGLVLCYLTLKTESVLPASLARGGVKAMAAAPLYFTGGSVSLMTGPSLYGVYGCLALLVCAVFFFLWMRRTELDGRLHYEKPAPRKKKKQG